MESGTKEKKGSVFAISQRAEEEEEEEGRSVQRKWHFRYENEVETVINLSEAWNHSEIQMCCSFRHLCIYQNCWFSIHTHSFTIALPLVVWSEAGDGKRAKIEAL